jgi:hypothetical protein
MVAWVFFRATDWHAAAIMIRGMFADGGLYLPASYADRLGGAAAMLGRLGWQFGASPDSWAYPTRDDLAMLAAFLAFVLFAPNTQQILAHARPALGVEAADAPRWLGRWRWRASAAGGVATAVACVVCLVVVLKRQSDAFIYFQF